MAQLLDSNLMLDRGGSTGYQDHHYKSLVKVPWGFQETGLTRAGIDH